MFNNDIYVHILNIFLLIRKEDVEKFKDKDLLATLMIEMAADYPELRKVIVDERDKYLTYNLQMSAGFDIEPNGHLTNLIDSDSSKY